MKVDYPYKGGKGGDIHVWISNNGVAHDKDWIYQSFGSTTEDSVMPHRIPRRDQQ